MGKTKTNRELLCETYSIPAVQLRYHREGRFYRELTEFPGALADQLGYVVFPTKEEYLKSYYLDHRSSSKTPRVCVSGGISKLPTYRFYRTIQTCSSCGADVVYVRRCKQCGGRYCYECMEDDVCPTCGFPEWIEPR